MKDATGKTIRVGDHVYIKNWNYTTFFHETIDVFEVKHIGIKAAHVRVTTKNGYAFDLRASIVYKMTKEEFVLWKMEQ